MRAYGNAFFTRANQLIEQASFKLTASIIDKPKLIKRYTNPFDPYHLAIQFCLERINRYLATQQQAQALTHVIFESRGKTEDKDLELAFRRICDENEGFNFEPIFASKAINSGGLQLADLIARPLGIHYLKPEQSNRAYEIAKQKLISSGLKVFPE